MDERLMRGASPAQAEILRRAMAQQQLDQLAQQTTPLCGAMRLGSGEPQARKIGPKEVKEAAAILQKYKSGKANLERRVIEDEEWYKIRHWGVVRDRKRWAKACGCQDDERRAPEPSSAWLFNAIMNKHADAMDNYPEPVVLPREASDKQSAVQLGEVLPVVLETNDFESTYDAAWWQKLKHGTAVYGVFWDAEKDNGLGDIAIREIDLLNIFWEPGITDVQTSRNLFITELVDTDTLDAAYPQFAGRMNGGGSVDVGQYVYDDTVDTSEKSVVVDWYYRRKQPSGKTVVHYCKFVNDCVLYASEDDPEYAARGYYDHGKYPVVFDTLFPEEGTPTGFGYVAVCREPQLYIDRLYANILDYADKATRPRFFMASSTGVNEREFGDWNKPIVHVEGTLDETRMRQIDLAPMSGLYTDIINMKINELKETSANQDVNQGGAPGGGVTAASAIAALQEAGNKSSRDMISASYRSMVELCQMAIDLMRQFYDVARAFRVTGPQGEMDFVQFSNAGITAQPVGVDAAGMTLYREPVFDLKITAQKKNPFSRLEQNERAKELYGMGFFSPDRAQEALGALDMMDFEGIEDVRKYVQQGKTLLQIVQQQAALIAQLTGAAMPAQPQGGASATPESAGAGVDQATGNAGQIPMTRQSRRMAAAATPHV